MATVIVDAPFVHLRGRVQFAVLFGPQNRPCFGHAFYGRWVLRMNHRREGRCIHYRELGEPCPACFTLHRAHVAENDVVRPLIIDCGRDCGWPVVPDGW